MPSPITQNVAVTAAKLAPVQPAANVAREASSAATNQSVSQKLSSTDAALATAGVRPRDQILPRKPPQVESHFPAQRYKKDARKEQSADQPKIDESGERPRASVRTVA